MFEGECPQRFSAIQAVAERKLAQLEAAQTLDFCALHQEIGWKNWLATGKVNGAFVSTHNGVYALLGLISILPM